MSLRRGLKRFLILGISSLVAVNFLFMSLVHASAFNENNLIDDEVFNNSTSMSSGAINNFLNGLASSCISPNSGFQAPDPTGYSPSGGFTYGANVTAGQVIADAAQAYGINPQVLLTTLEQQESLVSGNTGCSTAQYAKAMGYGCPDGGGSYNYSGIDLYTLNGTTYTSVNDICVQSATQVGFSEQIIHAAWFLEFGMQRSEGNISWDTQSTNFPQSGDVWNNSDDPESCYSGPMTQGTFQICPGGSSTYYDGYDTIDGQSIYMGDGATAALYWYTPHLSAGNSFDTIFTNWFGSLSSCDYPKGQDPTAPNTYNDAGADSLPGYWTSTTHQSFLYMTPNGSGGFDVGVMDPVDNTLQWRGTWWSETNSNINLSNTVFIPATDSDGLTDLYYATSTNWNKPGFTVGLMRNTGSGFSYGGTQWVTSSLSLASTKFIPGNFTTGGGSQGFAYATPNYSGGFDVGVMAPSGGTLQWRGTWWSQTNGSIDLTNTVFIPADTDGSGLTDLYYATSTNWSNPGFSVGLMHDNGSGFTYGGPQWTNTTLNLGTTVFIPGSWTGGGVQGFAYATSCGTRGFDISVMSPSSNGLVWQGEWWEAPTLALSDIDFIPADVDGNGYTSLFYVTPNGSYGFSVALQHNNANGSGFTWEGVQWSPTTLPLTDTLFLPSP